MTTAAQPSLTQKTASGVAWTTAFQVARQLLQVVSVSVLARHVAPAAYGLIGMAVLVTNLLETIRDAGIGQALIREQEITDEVASTAFWLNCFVGVIAALLVNLAAWPASLFFHQPQIVLVLRVLSISFFLGALGVVPLATLNRGMQFKKLAVVQTTAAIVGTVVAIAVALLGGNVWSLVSGSLTIVAATTAGVWILAPFRLRPVLHGDTVKRILHFGLNLSGYQVFNYFSRNADNLLVGKFLGSVALGFYQMGYMLMTYPLQNFTIMVTQVVYPAMAKFHDDHARVRAAYLRTSALVALVTLPIMLGMGITASPFVRVVLGARWAPVTQLLVVFAPLGALQAIYAPSGVLFNIEGRTDLRFRWMIVCSVIYVLSFVLGLRWGIMGVATCYSMAWVLLMVPSYLIPFRLVELSGWTFIKTLWPTVWIGLAMTAACGGWRYLFYRQGVTQPVLEFLTTVLLGIAVYVGLLLWSRPPVLAELKTVLEGTSYGAARWIGSRLPRPSRSIVSESDLDPFVPIQK
ncbi:MAG TPA: MOP flippase family protein [Candidatus Bathyarchaeia archaeon]|nr:MOP flippase family protein [Candidatus Bathyarchaeia archaeon]